MLYCSMAARWQVEFTDQFADWFVGLDEDDQDRVAGAVEWLEQEGPALGRPFVDAIKGSRHQNMKELRPRGGHLRALFAFDPRRAAILLLGGDKRDRWQSWYEEAIPVADALYEVYLAELIEEGILP